MIGLTLFPEWECRTCTAAQKATRGCEKPARQPVPIDGEAVARCAMRLRLDDPQFCTEVFWLYQNYLRGILPEGTALSSNPHKLVEAFRVIENAKMDADEMKDSRERKKKELRDALAAKMGARPGA